MTASFQVFYVQSVSPNVQAVGGGDPVGQELTMVNLESSVGVAPGVSTPGEEWVELLGIGVAGGSSFSINVSSEAVNGQRWQIEWVALDSDTVYGSNTVRHFLPFNKLVTTEQADGSSGASVSGQPRLARTIDGLTFDQIAQSTMWVKVRLFIETYPIDTWDSSPTAPRPVLYSVNSYQWLQPTYTASFSYESGPSLPTVEITDGGPFPNTPKAGHIRLEDTSAGTVLEEGIVPYVSGAIQWTRDSAKSLPAGDYRLTARALFDKFADYDALAEEVHDYTIADEGTDTVFSVALDQPGLKVDLIDGNAFDHTVQRETPSGWVYVHPEFDYAPFNTEVKYRAWAESGLGATPAPFAFGGSMLSTVEQTVGPLVAEGWALTDWETGETITFPSNTVSEQRQATNRQLATTAETSGVVKGIIAARTFSLRGHIVKQADMDKFERVIAADRIVLRGELGQHFHVLPTGSVSVSYGENRTHFDAGNGGLGAFADMGLIAEVRLSLIEDTRWT